MPHNSSLKADLLRESIELSAQLDTYEAAAGQAQEALDLIAAEPGCVMRLNVSVVAPSGAAVNVGELVTLEENDASVLSNMVKTRYNALALAQQASLDAKLGQLKAELNKP